MERREPPPLRTNDSRIVAVGTGMWVVLLVGVLLRYDAVRGAGLLWWIPMSACGVLWGLLGLLYLKIRPAQLARRAQARDQQRSARL